MIQKCHWKNVDRFLALQTLIKLLTDELKMVIPLSAEEFAESRKAIYAATEDGAEEAPPPKTAASIQPQAEPGPADGESPPR